MDGQWEMLGAHICPCISSIDAQVARDDMASELASESVCLRKDTYLASSPDDFSFACPRSHVLSLAPNPFPSHPMQSEV